jgi:hypothetical protein
VTHISIMDVELLYLRVLVYGCHLLLLEGVDFFLVIASSYPDLGSLVGILLTLFVLSSMNYSVGVHVID